MEGTPASCTVQRMVTVHLFCHGSSQGEWDRIMCTIIYLYDVIQIRSTAFLHRRRLLCTFNACWRVFSTKRLWM